MLEKDDVVKQRVVHVPNGGPEIIGPGPIVIIGPNGSGKSRRSRNLTSDVQIEIVSALRNTKISQQLQPMALQQAKQQFHSHRDNARNQPYELASDFDFMLTALIVESTEASLDYLSNARKGVEQELPPMSPLEVIQELWGKFFPGRELVFRDYMPTVINTVAVGDEPATYSAWQMSDGEKAALYLAGRALSAEKSAVLLVDEPETHFHSLLAVQFWDAIESARPDLRLIYVTHDMTFAASRKAAQYLLANPTNGLTPITLSSDSGDLAAVLLGTASLSFYATRVIFCEGDSESLDARLYSAWFKSNKDIVQAVGSCEMVFRSVAALESSSLVSNLTVNGVVDRDFRGDENLASLPAGITALGVHEVETLFSLPDVVEAMAGYLKVDFDKADYESKVIGAYNDGDRQKVSLERWKLRINASLTSVVSSVSTKNDSLDDIVAAIPNIFDPAGWSFSPKDLLQEEKDRIERIFKNGPRHLVDVLQLMPGKHLRALPAAALGILPKRYDDLLIRAVMGADPDLKDLSNKLRDALKPYLPA